MRASFLRSGVIAFAASAVCAAGALGLAGWPQPSRTVELTGLTIAAILASAAQRQTPLNRAALPLSFVVNFSSLLLLGPGATLLVAAAGAIAQGLADPDRPRGGRRTLVDTATVTLAVHVAGLAHRMLGGTIGHFSGPSQATPIAVAVLAYCLVRNASAEVLVPIMTRRRIERSWTTRLLAGCPQSFAGVALAVGFVEAIDHRMWSLLAVAAVPLFFLYQAYNDYMGRLEDADRRREVISALDQGIAVVNAGGRLTIWDDALERIVGCGRERALGRSIAAAVPAFAGTGLPRALDEVLSAGNPRTVTVRFPGDRLLQIDLLPVVDGVTLICRDATERARAEQGLRRSEERLALAAEGANDGLWAWDLRRGELYCSGRWRSLVGLPAESCIGRPTDWFNRVHADDLAALKQAVETHLSGTTNGFEHEHRLRHEDGTYRWFLCRAIAQRGAGGRPARLAGSLTDTTEGALARERLRSAGYLDPLTGLSNRAVFVEGLGRRLTEFKQRHGGDRFAVLYLDLDRFKVVNDSLGHLVGDELLTAVSRRLETCLRPADALARLGGDEFAILLDGLGDEQQANAIAFRIQKALNAPFSIGGREVFTSASIGIAISLEQYNTPDEIMRDADTAMYHAKARGKARHEMFDADMHARALDRLGFENDLRHAVNSNDFEVHYQPIVSLASDMCVGFESLIRWSRNGTVVSPATFIPIAEELGLIEPLGTWVLQEACRTFADWQRRFPDNGLDCITVNVSSRQLMQQNFLSIVEDAVDQAGLRPCDLRLEITETALMDSPNVAAHLLRELRDFGVKIYLDDFGTGYSSLSHLHKLPVDALKIDRSFVRSLQLTDRPAIVESILALARTLNTSVVAEGIESEAQARELERLGCTHAQGYFFSRPLTIASVEELLLLNRPLRPQAVQPPVVPAA